MAKNTRFSFIFWIFDTLLFLYTDNILIRFMCCSGSHYFIIPYYIIFYFIIPYFIYAFNIKLFLTDLRRIIKYIIRIQNTWVTRSMLNRERPSTVCLTHYTSMLIVISSRQTIASRSKDNQPFGYHS